MLSNPQEGKKREKEECELEETSRKLPSQDVRANISTIPLNDGQIRQLRQRLAEGIKSSLTIYGY